MFTFLYHLFSVCQSTVRTVLSNRKKESGTHESFLWSCKKKWSEVAQSCPTLCNPVDCSLPGFSIHEIFQARVPEWVAISFSNKKKKQVEFMFMYFIETNISRILWKELRYYYTFFYISFLFLLFIYCAELIAGLRIFDLHWGMQGLFVVGGVFSVAACGI